MRHVDALSRLHEDTPASEGDAEPEDVTPESVTPAARAPQPESARASRGGRGAARGAAGGRVSRASRPTGAGEPAELPVASWMGSPSSGGRCGLRLVPNGPKLPSPRGCLPAAPRRTARRSARPPRLHRTSLRHRDTSSRVGAAHAHCRSRAAPRAAGPAE